MEINKSNDLESLSSALQYFFQKTKIKPTYEYVLLKGFNDTVQDAHDLISFCKKIPSKVNLIEFNTWPGVKFEPTERKDIEKFSKYIQDKGFMSFIRRSRGDDVLAACGQLRTESQKRKKT